MTSPIAPPSPDAAQGSAWMRLAAAGWHWPWWETLRTLRVRFREDRLGLTAGSLTFTTLIALVPLLTVALAVFSAFPVFASFQGALERLLLQNLVPDSIAKPVMGALAQFAGKASRIGALGLVLLGVTALALVMTIDRTLNALWRVRRRRPFTQRLLVYWGVLTLGPLLLGASLSLTWWLLSSSRGLVAALPGGLGLLVDTVQFSLLAATAAMLYRYVPNTEVRWAHAWAGGLFVSLGVEVAKAALAWYVSAVPTLRSIYGAFSIAPILLLWVYLLWVVVLLGAVIAAYAPTLSMRLAPRSQGPGRRFDLALSVLRRLEAARHTPAHGLAVAELAQALRADPLEVEPLVEFLVGTGWVGRLDDATSPRVVLLADPSLTPAAPLVDGLLVEPSASTEPFRQRAGVSQMRLADLIG